MNNNESKKDIALKKLEEWHDQHAKWMEDSDFGGELGADEHRKLAKMAREARLDDTADWSSLLCKECGKQTPGKIFYLCATCSNKVITGGKDDAGR